MILTNKWREIWKDNYNMQRREFKYMLTYQKEQKSNNEKK